MMMPMQMGPPKESTWDEIVGDLRIQKANSEKALVLLDAQLREAESKLAEVK